MRWEKLALINRSRSQTNTNHFDNKVSNSRFTVEKSYPRRGVRLQTARTDAYKVQAPRIQNGPERGKGEQSVQTPQRSRALVKIKWKSANLTKREVRLPTLQPAEREIAIKKTGTRAHLQFSKWQEKLRPARAAPLDPSSLFSCNIRRGTLSVIPVLPFFPRPRVAADFSDGLAEILTAGNVAPISISVKL